MADCIFCKIVNKEIPSDIFYEDDEVLAFMDIRPVVRGHALVLPRKHSEDFVSTDEKTLKELMPRVRKIAEALMKAVNASGINITTNNGASSGQAVFHLHFHLIPRKGGDNLAPWPHQEVEPKTRKEIAELMKKML